MNILLISQYFFPENFIINNVVSKIAERGHKVTVLTGRPNYPGGFFLPRHSWAWPEQGGAAPARVVRVWHFPRRSGRGLALFINYVSFAYSATMAIPFLRLKADVIFVYQPSPVTVGLPAIVARWITGAPMLFWTQDLWPESLSATGAIKHPVALGMVRHLVRAIYRRSRIIAVPSRAFVAPVRELAPAADIRYLPNPADPIDKAGNDHPPDGGDTRLPRQSFRILFTGNLGTAQGLETVLDAAEATRHVAEIRWILVGDGRMRSHLEAQIVARELGETVEILGPFPPDRMPSLFAEADALLLTLRPNALFKLTVPAKLSAYFAAGRPILAATDGEAARLVEEAGAGITSPAGDAKALAAAAITLLAMSPAERQAMGDAGRAYHACEFTLDQVVDRLEDLLIEIKGSTPCES